MLVLGGADLVVAIATVDRPVTTGLERHFGVLATFRAYGGEHLTPWPESEAVVVLAFFPRRTARRTALGIIQIASAGKELLLFDTEGEGGIAVAALK